MSDEEALNVTYPLYHIDNRYSNKSINGEVGVLLEKQPENMVKKDPKNVKLSRKYQTSNMKFMYLVYIYLDT